MTVMLVLMAAWKLCLLTVVAAVLGPRATLAAKVCWRGLWTRQVFFGWFSRASCYCSTATSCVVAAL